MNFPLGERGRTAVQILRSYYGLWRRIYDDYQQSEGSCNAFCSQQRGMESSYIEQHYQVHIHIISSYYSHFDNINYANKSFSAFLFSVLLMGR